MLFFSNANFGINVSDRQSNNNKRDRYFTYASSLLVAASFSDADSARSAAGPSPIIVSGSTEGLEAASKEPLALVFGFAVPLLPVAFLLSDII